MTKWVLPEGRAPLSANWLRYKAQDYSSIDRVEVIDENGRSYTNSNVTSVKLDLQDSGKTLKVFISK